MLVSEAVNPAIETTKRLLFRPAQIGVWFSFGFIFFLQSCSEGGGFNYRVPDFSGLFDKDGSDTTSSFLHALGGASSPWPHLDQTTIIAIAVAAFIVAIPLIILAAWFGARGQMMAIFAVSTGDAQIGKAWRETQAAGSSYFRFELVIMGLGLLALLPIAAFGVMIYMSASDSGFSHWTDLWPKLAILAVVAAALFTPMIVVRSLARNFVAPIMLRQSIGAREAWTRFWGHAHVSFKDLLLFYLLKFVFLIAAGFITVFVVLFTCCIGALPVINQTLLSPWHVFERAWTLEMLASVDPSFDLRRVGGDVPGYLETFG